MFIALCNAATLFAPSGATCSGEDISMRKRHGAPSGARFY